jgi:hypothetical protein
MRRSGTNDDKNGYLGIGQPRLFTDELLTSIHHSPGTETGSTFYLQQCAL